MNQKKQDHSNFWIQFVAVSLLFIIGVAVFEQDNIQLTKKLKQ
ncbi:Uncharacterised protein [BD1-7 clade bacterium]|uniref:Uncharacterized protein n=1 Tax=BD1-7 clade bacterium TaxID=2029982 RepID=A0A5S9QWU7_9GAMM|nr:Uncharacterised protein [BD1-7 clade bacterium]